MNKRSMKKGFPVRLLALLLCCFCLLSAIPTQALATDDVTPPAQEELTPEPQNQEKEVTPAPQDQNQGEGGDSKTEAPQTEEPKTEEPKTEEPQTEDPKVEEPTLSLYDRLMACETVEEVNAILDNLTEEESLEMELFTEEQQVALEQKLDSMGFYGVNDLASAQTAQRAYNGNNMVAYDIMINKKGQNDSSKLAEIKLNGIDVEHANSTECWTKRMSDGLYALQTPSYLGTGKKLSEYYGADLNKNSQPKSVTLTIKPADGYYVTNVIIPCCNGGLPSSCGVWSQQSNIFEEDFTLETGREVSLSVPSSAFGHYTSSSEYSERGEMQYFIMVVVAPIPTPTYVEYDYGEIVNLGGDVSIFNDADVWTSVTDGNNYGTTDKPDTNYTQYRYTYAGNDPANSKVWKHYANTVTPTAKANAASKGYCFAGWKAEYYTSCSAQNRSNSKGGSYTYTFKDKYNSVNYDESENVQIFAHVKLTAQWKPIELKVTKVVEGLQDGFLVDHNYTIQVQKQNGDVWEKYQDVTLTVNGNGSASQTLSPITPGTYRAIETDGKNNLTSDTTIMYITVSDGGQVSYSTEDIKTSQELFVTNTYSPKPATQKLTIVKNVTGNSQDPTKSFSFKVTATNTTGTMTMGETSGDNLVFSLSKGGSVAIEVPVGATVTVTEDPGTYSPSYVSDGVTGDVVDTEEPRAYGTTFTMPSKDCTVTFTNNKNVKIETAVDMDFAPYVLLLTVTAFGALLLLRKRRSV